MTEPVALRAHRWPRDPDDWYVEPVWCTTALLDVERFPGHVHDPACGMGNIVEACQLAHVSATGSDLVRRVPDGHSWFAGEYDFLACHHARHNIVCNPPFFKGAGTERFIRHALKVAVCKVAIFADLQFLASSDRAENLFAEHPPARVYVLSPRPSCPPGASILAGRPAAGGKPNWCWMVWDKTSPRTATTFHWLKGEPPRARRSSGPSRRR